MAKYDHVGGGRYDVYRKRKGPNLDDILVWVVLGFVALVLLGQCSG